MFLQWQYVFVKKILNSQFVLKTKNKNISATFYFYTPTIGVIIVHTPTYMRLNIFTRMEKMTIVY